MHKKINDKDLRIIFQGPICFENKSILEYDKRIIISTIDDYSEKEKNIPNKIVRGKRPSFPGHKNINYQVASTLAGLKYEPDYKFVIKIRSDIYIKDKEEFINSFEFNEKTINSVYWHNYININDYENGYAFDYIFGGTKENIVSIFLHLSKNADLYTDPFPEKHILESIKKEENITVINNISKNLKEDSLFWIKMDKFIVEYCNKYPEYKKEKLLINTDRKIVPQII